MTLTGGVATGIVTWGVNEPLIYYGNVWGELDQLGIKPFTPEAAQFAMKFEFTVNGKNVSLEVPPDRRLLDILREDLGLTGTKEGCGEGECGAWVF